MNDNTLLNIYNSAALLPKGYHRYLFLCVDEYCKHRQGQQINFILANPDCEKGKLFMNEVRKRIVYYGHTYEDFSKIEYPITEEESIIAHEKDISFLKNISL